MKFYLKDPTEYTPVPSIGRLDKIRTQQTPMFYQDNGQGQKEVIAKLLIHTLI
jgi:hypothetical protein